MLNMKTKHKMRLRETFRFVMQDNYTIISLVVSKTHNQDHNNPTQNNQRNFFDNNDTVIQNKRTTCTREFKSDAL